MEEEVRGEIPTVRTGTAYKAGWTDEVAKSAEIRYSTVQPETHERGEAE